MSNCVKLLDYDSCLFGYQVAKIDAYDLKINELENIFINLRDIGVRLVYLYIPNFDTNLHMALTKNGCQLIDKKITYQMKLSENLSYEINPKIKSILGNKLNDRIIFLSIQSGEYSRFKIDHNFKNNEFTKLYKEWIKKSLNGEIACDVFAFEENNRILGLITLNIEKFFGTIGLIAVDKKFQGKKIGSSLLESAVMYFKKKSLQELQVTTQMNNISACGFYENFGFKKSNITYIYHFWL